MLIWWYWCFTNATTTDDNNDDNTPASTVTATATINKSTVYNNNCNNYDNNSVIFLDSKKQKLFGNLISKLILSKRFLVSHNVPSLFTNILLQETIDIVINLIFNYNPTQNITKNEL